MTQERLPLFRRLWAHDKTVDGLKVAIALAGVVAGSLVADRQHWMISLILGVIACALAESEDRVSGRLKALLMTLLCFAVVTFSVQWLFPWPWLFVVGLMLSTFGFVMLGAAGERYATIAVASLVLAVYTMLSVDHQQHATLASAVPEHDWLQPVLLLGGAAWYGFISLVATALFSTRAARQSLARVFEALSAYLALKAALLEPVSHRDEDAQRLALAEQNARLVRALNRAREVLTRWVQQRRPNPIGARHLKWYFLAQDVHERASSAHYPYAALAGAFARSDILFRAQRLMQMESQSCRRLADAILADTLYEHGNQGLYALDDLAAALAHLQAQPQAGQASLLESLADLCRNVTTIERLLSNAGRPDALPLEQDSSLRDYAPGTLTEGLKRIRVELTPAAPRFRHGLRLALALATGYGLLHWLDLPQGYWVLLTTVFVCQPTYSDTWRRLGQRVMGTALGLVASWLFISAFPHPLAQLTLAVVAGVAFFALRTDRYLQATLCITVLVMICFNQLGSGYALIWPRLLDTVLGALIAGLAVAFVLPDWQGRRLPALMARTVSGSARYLAEILAQYRSSKRDDLPYRIARRDAHNADAELSSTLASMQAEPEHQRLPPELAFRFLCLSHTLLGYISALGAHREHVEHWQHAALVDEADRHIQQSLQGIAGLLGQTSSATTTTGAAKRVAVQADDEAALERRLADIPVDAGPTERRVLRQLALIAQLIPQFAAQADELVAHQRQAMLPVTERDVVDIGEVR
ncbi:MAG: YccS family putative transporter [Moraxellaceae bacterium]|nr:YccS family putative transporter [Moraxellaceae bacterium]